MSMHYTYEEAAQAIHTTVADVKRFDTNKNGTIGDIWSEECSFKKYRSQLEAEAKKVGKTGSDNLNSYSVQRNHVKTLSEENNAVAEYNKTIQTYLNTDAVDGNGWSDSSYDVQIGDGTKYISGYDLLHSGNKEMRTGYNFNGGDLSRVNTNVGVGYTTCKIYDNVNNCDITVTARRISSNKDGSYNAVFEIKTMHGDYTTPVQTIKGEMTAESVEKLIENTNFYDTSKSDEVKTPETGFEETLSTTVERKAITGAGAYQYASAYKNPDTGESLPTSGAEFEELKSYIGNNVGSTVNLPEKIGTYELYPGDLNDVVQTGKISANNGTTSASTASTAQIETTGKVTRGFVVDKDGNKHFTEYYANKTDAEQAVNKLLEEMKQQGLV